MRSGVLFISPSHEDARALAAMLGPVSIPVVHAGNLTEARARLDHESFGAILTEAYLPDGTWEDVLELNRVLPRKCSVVVTDARADSRLWLDVLEHGAYDLICQPYCCAEVQRIVSNALAAPQALRRTA